MLCQNLCYLAKAVLNVIEDACIWKKRKVKINAYIKKGKVENSNPVS